MGDGCPDQSLPVPPAAPSWLAHMSPSRPSPQSRKKKANWHRRVPIVRLRLTSASSELVQEEGSSSCPDHDDVGGHMRHAVDLGLELRRGQHGACERRSLQRHRQQVKEEAPIDAPDTPCSPSVPGPTGGAADRCPPITAWCPLPPARMPGRSPRSGALSAGRRGWRCTRLALQSCGRRARAPIPPAAAAGAYWSDPRRTERCCRPRAQRPSPMPRRGPAHDGDARESGAPDPLAPKEAAHLGLDLGLRHTLD